MSTLIIHFGRSAYFERRNGDTILSPAEQEVVLNALHKAGVKEDFHFDKYLDLYNWFDRLRCYKAIAKFLWFTLPAITSNAPHY